MRRFTGPLALFLLLSLLAACGREGRVRIEKIPGCPLPVKRVEDMPEDFLLGMDVSSVLAEERSGVRYYDFDGEEKDLFQILAGSGVNTIRVRVWNDPYDGEGRGYGGGNCDIEAAVAIGRRATAAGQGLLVDFHYSDFWADPGKQQAPKAWQDLSLEEKAEALFAYTRDSLKALKRAGVRVTMVQVGNETNGALCGETDWSGVTALMAAGARAVRQVYPKALVAVHFTNPERVGSYGEYARILDRYGVDYDVFGSSYYPFWHGSLENLSRALGNVAKTYGKKVMVLETSYANTEADTDFFPNTVGEGSQGDRPYPFTVRGQADALRDVMDTVVHTPGGLGVCYWEGAWISVGARSREENQQLWERWGSGWASSTAAAYDPQDAGRYYGGSAVDNQCFFDAGGRPRESLRVFNLARWGNEGE